LEDLASSNNFVLEPAVIEPAVKQYGLSLVHAAPERQLDENGRLPAVGNTVDLESARYSNSIGQAEFALHWTDPDFNPQHSAFYYARILQIPTPRNALFDARALGLDTPPKGPNTIQERAYTSPIWYQP
jgi:hypothetical protein